VKFYLLNLSNLAKTEKTHRSIALEQEINPVQIPTLPRQHSNIQIPPFPGTTHSQMSRVCPGGWMFKLQFYQYIISYVFFVRVIFLSETPTQEKKERIVSSKRRGCCTAKV